MRGMGRAAAPASGEISAVKGASKPTVLPGMR